MGLSIALNMNDKFILEEAVKLAITQNTDQINAKKLFEQVEKRVDDEKAFNESICVLEKKRYIEPGGARNNYGEIIYDLESKNYNDLVIENTSFPSILILFVLPEDEDAWLDASDERLIIRKCAWWYSLEGQPPTTNLGTKRIKIPENQVFSPEALHKLMENVKGGHKL